MNWKLYAIGYAIILGLGYTFLKPLTQELSVYTINASYGALLFITSMIGAYYYEQTDNISNITKQWKYLLLVCSCFVIPAFLYVIGYKESGDNTAAFTAISSMYPLFLLIFMALIYGKQDINYKYAISGVIAILIGVGLLSYSHKTFRSPNST